MALLPGKVSHMAWLLWFMVGLRRRNTFRLEPTWYGRFGLHRNAVHRGLRAVEAVQLISVKRKPGAAPEVTLLDVVPAENVTIN